MLLSDYLFQKEILELEAPFKARLKTPLGFDDILSINGQVFKSVDSRKTMYFKIADKGYYIKIHYGVGWREIFKNLFNLRVPVISAQNEYHAIHKLAELDIASLTMAGFGRRGINPARLQSFIITHALNNHISLANYCKDWQKFLPDLKLKRQLIRQVAEITRRLHINGINHRDLYLCHFLMERQDGSSPVPNLYLIDLHRVQIRSTTPIRWKVKDLAALHFSSMDIGLTHRDRLRFMRAYSGEDSLRLCLARNAHLWKKVMNKATALYQKHSHK